MPKITVYKYNYSGFFKHNIRFARKFFYMFAEPQTFFMQS